MPQLSLYLNDETMKELREAAHAKGLSLSKYAGSLFRDRLQPAWPEGYFDLYGALKDESFREPDALDASFDGPLPSFDVARSSSEEA